MEILQVCLVLCMIYCRFSIKSCTANQSDFVLGSNTQLTFTSGSLNTCLDIEILDDSNVEGDHQFEILITDVTLGGFMMNSSVTTITIIDNSGIYLLPFYVEVLL